MTDTDKMTTTFKIEDIKIGSTVVAGRSTSRRDGRKAAGTVTAVIPGVCIRVDNGVQPSVLWGDFEIVGLAPAPAPAPAEPAAAEMPPAAPPLRRTDSGADYGVPGYPDCEFWEAQGVEPVFVATADMYSRTACPGEPRLILTLLEEAGEPEAGTAADRAWKRQFASASGLLTPPSSPKATPVCPDAPLRAARPPPITIPTLDDHRGLGILAGDWIKPDPVMTRQETRTYVVAETERWLTGRICRHAQDLAIADGLTVEAEVAEGKWPAGRLFLVANALEGTDIVPASAGGEPAIWYHSVGVWAAGVCADHLCGYEAGIPAAKLAVGFVTTDRLPCGKVIADFWDHSPFAALRSAPPLPDTDSESEEEEDSESEEEVATVRPSLDAPLDAVDDAVREFMAKPMHLTLYGWQWTALAGGVISYLWLIAMLLSWR
jgi:hypothetical protein